MAVTTQAGIPTVLEAGGTVLFTENFTDYPSSRWTGKLYVNILGGTPQSVTAANNGTNGYLFTVNANSNWPAGRYTYAIYATEMATNQRATAKTGVLQVIPDLTKEPTASTAATLLANIETAINSFLVNKAMQTVSVGGVSYSRADMSTLISMRTRLKAEVIAEGRAADAFRGLETSGRIGTRFKS